MKISQLPEAWKAHLIAHIESKFGDSRDWLAPEDFDHHIRLSYLDDTFLEFSNAFHIVDEDSGMVGIFTQNVGHHIFPLKDAKIEPVDEWEN